MSYVVDAIVVKLDYYVDNMCFLRRCCMIISKRYLINKIMENISGNKELFSTNITIEIGVDGTDVDLV